MSTHSEEAPTAASAERWITTSEDAFYHALAFDTVEQERYLHLKARLSGSSHLFSGQAILDFGCSWGLSAAAFIKLGAATVLGIEPNAERVAKGRRLLADAGFSDRVELRHVADTAHTGLNERFSFVSVVAVLEHIPAPRDAYLREMWRLVAPGGVLYVDETPNFYWPREDHTTGGLWFNRWLPKEIAHRRAIRRGRFDPDRSDWESSGWRGVGYREMVRPLAGYSLQPENTHKRHQLFSALGLPASLLDPYPTWVLVKD